MALAYKRTGSKFTGNKELETKIVAGLNFWFTNDFICPNWWYPQIGVPKTLAPVMLLLEDKLTTEQMNAGIKILDTSGQGKNIEDRKEQEMTGKKSALSFSKLNSSEEYTVKEQRETESERERQRER